MSVEREISVVVEDGKLAWNGRKGRRLSMPGPVVVRNDTEEPLYYQEHECESGSEWKELKAGEHQRIVDASLLLSRSQSSGGNGGDIIVIIGGGN